MRNVAHTGSGLAPRHDVLTTIVPHKMGRPLMRAVEHRMAKVDSDEDEMVPGIPVRPGERQGSAMPIGGRTVS